MQTDHISKRSAVAISSSSSRSVMKAGGARPWLSDGATRAPPFGVSRLGVSRQGCDDGVSRFGVSRMCGTGRRQLKIPGGLPGARCGARAPRPASVEPPLCVSNTPFGVSRLGRCVGRALQHRSRVSLPIRQEVGARALAGTDFMMRWIEQRPS